MSVRHWCIECVTGGNERWSAVMSESESERGEVLGGAEEERDGEAGSARAVKGPRGRVCS